MALPTYQLSCTQKELLTKDVYALKFTKPAGFTFKPGQFVLLRIPLPGKPDDIQPRAYSICSAPHEDEFFFIVKHKPGGRTSIWMTDVLEIGTTVDMQGPFGPFALLNDDLPIAMIATGTGVAPFVSHLRDIASRNDQRRIDLLFGVRNEGDLFLEDELKALAQKIPNFFLHIALSQPGKEWHGHIGRIQTLLPKVVTDLSERQVYICGNPDMTKDMKAHAIELGVPKERLHVEGFI